MSPPRFTQPGGPAPPLPPLEARRHRDVARAPRRRRTGLEPRELAAIEAFPVHRALVHEIITALESRVRDGRPRAPRRVVTGAGAVEIDRNQRTVVEAQRAPADVAGCLSPRYVRRRPRRPRKPKPAAGRKSPAAVVV